MTLQIVGLILILAGGFQLLDPSDQLENRLVRSIQKLAASKAALAVFREIWFFGRTSFTLVIIILLICANWKAGLLSAVVFLLAASIEMLIKSALKRVRPFQASQDIKMLQPLAPSDPSFPSGDALRVWHLALIVPVFAGGNLALMLIAAGLALLVTLGRMVMGVHYLTDTLAGAGLGLLGAGTTIWLWTYFNLL